MPDMLQRNYLQDFPSSIRREYNRQTGDKRVKNSEVCPHCNFPHEICVCNKSQGGTKEYDIDYANTKWQKMTTVIKFSESPPNITELRR